MAHTVTKSRKTSTQKNQMLLMKNPQFLTNQADILPSEFIHWTDILTKFHNNWTKTVDFLVIEFYFPGWTFFWSQCGLQFVHFSSKFLNISAGFESLSLTSFQKSFVFIKQSFTLNSCFGSSFADLLLSFKSKVKCLHHYNILL